MKHLLIYFNRETYRFEDVEGMTVSELIDELKTHDPDAIVAIGDVNYGSHIYGGVREYADGYFRDVDSFIEVEDKPDDEDGE